jgi:5'-nucleotidase
MHILLTNDDGIYADGLWALYRQFIRKHLVTVIAPDRERSAVGHGITLHEPLRAYQVSVNGCNHGYAVSGTPADCIKLGLLEILKDKPDLVISGINPGANVGININYSGTVSAAREAALFGLLAIAVSMDGEPNGNYADGARFAEKVAHEVAQRGLPVGTLLNVNIPNVPAEEIKGVRISRQGTHLSEEFIEKRKDPRNRTYYWQGCEKEIQYAHQDIDGAVLKQSYISITPIKCDATDYSTIEYLKTWPLQNGDKKRQASVSPSAGA